MTGVEPTGSGISVDNSDLQQDPSEEQRPPGHRCSEASSSDCYLELINLSSQMTSMDILPNKTLTKERKSNKKRVRFNIPEEMDVPSEKEHETVAKRKPLKPVKRSKSILIWNKRTLELCTPMENLPKQSMLKCTKKESLIPESKSTEDIFVIKKRKTAPQEAMDLNINNNCQVSDRVVSAMVGLAATAGIGDVQELFYRNNNCNCDICKNVKLRKRRSTTRRCGKKVGSNFKTSTRKIYRVSAKGKPGQKRNTLLGRHQRYVLGTNRKLITRFLRGYILYKKSVRCVDRNMRKPDKRGIKRIANTKKSRSAPRQRKACSLFMWEDSECPCREQRSTNKSRQWIKAHHRRAVKKKHVLKVKMATKRYRDKKKKAKYYKQRCRRRRRRLKIKPIKREEETAEDLRMNLLKYRTIQFAKENSRRRDDRFHCCRRRCWRTWEDLDVEDVYADHE